MALTDAEKAQLRREVDDLVQRDGLTLEQARRRVWQRYLAYQPHYFTPETLEHNREQLQSLKQILKRKGLICTR